MDLQIILILVYQTKSTYSWLSESIWYQVAGKVPENSLPANPLHLKLISWKIKANVESKWVRNISPDLIIAEVSIFLRVIQPEAMDIQCKDSWWQNIW
jgi:hypothetical protein